MMLLARHILFGFLALLSLTAMAQEENVYRLELGGGVGMGFGLTDTNTKWFGNMGASGTLVARFPLNPRMALKVVGGYMNLKGKTQGIDDFYPAHIDKVGMERLDFTTKGSIYDLNGLYELHFLPYGYISDYRGLRRIVPYLQMGLGLTYGTAGKAFTLNIPLGWGIKWKAAPRVNVGLDWTFHFTPNDKLDGLAAPRGIKSTEFRNKDFYCQTLFTITYDLAPSCPTCNKDQRVSY